MSKCVCRGASCYPTVLEHSYAYVRVCEHGESYWRVDLSVLIHVQMLIRTFIYRCLTPPCGNDGSRVCRQ